MLLLRTRQCGRQNAVAHSIVLDLIFPINFFLYLQHYLHAVRRVFFVRCQQRNSQNINAALCSRRNQPLLLFQSSPYSWYIRCYDDFLNLSNMDFIASWNDLAWVANFEIMDINRFKLCRNTFCNLTCFLKRILGNNL